MIFKAQLTINTDKLDITDPCYDEDVWCRTSVPVVPGQYTTEVWYYDDDEGYRDIRALLIYRSDSLYAKGDIDERALSLRSEYIDDIGVDSGTAGIYVNKPNYDDKTWRAIADYFYGRENAFSNKFYIATTQDNPTQCIGVTVSTGGDGGFPLYSMLDEGGNTVGYIVYFD